MAGCTGPGGRGTGRPPPCADAALGRIVIRLGLPRGVTADAACQELASRTGRDSGEIRAILFGPVPGDDAALVRLAADLDALEGQVLTL